MNKFWQLIIVFFLLIIIFYNYTETDQQDSKPVVNESEQNIVAIDIDVLTFECLEPEPAKDSVGFGLSFIQTRNCQVTLKQDNFGKVFTYQGQVVRLDSKISVTLSNTETGTKVSEQK